MKKEIYGVTLNTAVLLDTSIASNNMGDEIIMRSAENYLYPRLLKKYYVLRYPTHTIAFSTYQSLRGWEKAEFVRNADLKLVIGTDLLCKEMLHSINLWNINIFNCGPLKGTVTLGCGCSCEAKENIDYYTKKLYNKVLSHDKIHSTRDEETKMFLEQLGFKAVVTGCPTLWSLTPEFCKSIPTKKSDSVVFTLSGTARDYMKDQYLIDALNKNYETVYYWVQTIFDFDYLNKLKNTEQIQVLHCDLKRFGDFLASHSVDYVGVRLHGGIYAMQHGRRSIIISIDHRARNINENNHLNCIERSEIEGIEKMINQELKTEVNVEYKKISEWINQFDAI